MGGVPWECSLPAVPAWSVIGSGTAMAPLGAERVAKVLSAAAMAPLLYVSAYALRKAKKGERSPDPQLIPERSLLHHPFEWSRERKKRLVDENPTFEMKRMRT